MYEVALVFSVFCFLGVAFAFGRSKAFSLFHPLTFYLAFHGFIFVFRPIVAYFSDFQYVYRVFQFVPSASDKLTVILASNLGFLCFAAACFRAGGVAMLFRADRASAIEKDRLKPAFLWIMAICAPIGIYSLSKVWIGAATYNEGFEGMVRDAGTGVYMNTKNTGYLMEAQLMLATGTAIFAWLFRFRLLALLPLASFVLFRAGTGGRGVFVTALVTVGLLYLYEQRRRFPSMRVSLLLLAVIPAFAFVGNDRGAAIRRAVSSDAQSEIFGLQRSGEKFLEGMDFANMEYFEFVVYAVPQRSRTYSYFTGVLQVFTEPVPRALWAGKPIGAPFNQIKLFDYGRPIGMTRSLPGEGWYSLGWLGVIIWCSLWGWMLGWIYRRYAEGPQNAVQTAAYMMFLPVLIIAFRDGELVTVMRQGLFFIGPLVAWHYLARGLAIPTAQQLRTAMLRKNRTAKGERPLEPQALPASLDHLPPAVKRRHLSLRQSLKDPA